MQFLVTCDPVNPALTRARLIKMRCLKISYCVKMGSPLEHLNNLAPTRIRFLDLRWWFQEFSNYTRIEL